VEKGCAKNKTRPSQSCDGLPRFSWIYNAPASCRSNRRKTAPYSGC